MQVFIKFPSTEKGKLIKSSYTPHLIIGWNGAMILRGREKDGIVIFGIREIMGDRTQKAFP